MERYKVIPVLQPSPEYIYHLLNLSELPCSLFQFTTLLPPPIPRTEGLKYQSCCHPISRLSYHQKKFGLLPLLLSEHVFDTELSFLELIISF